MMIDYEIIEIRSQKQNSNKVLIIYTGGTLGMVYDEITKSLVPFNFKLIAENIPELNRLNIDVSVLALDQPIDSSNMSPEIWVELCDIIEKYYHQFHGFVVLHGTDTMAYTASALSFMIQNLTKPIIFTGAQLPIGVPRTDARENLLSSVEIAGASLKHQAIVSEICIYFNGKLFRANRAKKEESNELDAFESENYPYLATIGVDIEYHFNNFLAKTEAPTIFNTALNNNVGILKLFPGVSENFIHHFFDTPNLKGLVLETYGSGNAFTLKWFIELIKIAISKNIIILNVSQCVGGKVIMGKYETSSELLKMGVLSGSDITTEAAITKLMWVLGQNLDIAASKLLLTQNLVGELSA